METIPLFDMNQKLMTHQNLIASSINRVIESGHLILGPEVEQFEEAFADFLGVRFATGVANGTDALEIAMRALDVHEGTLVGMAANAGGYARFAAEILGAKVIYGDVDSESHCISISETIKLVQLGAKVIVVTHLFGRVAPDIYEISHYCKKNGVALIEDCAQAHGARNSDGTAGSFGNLATFSFYPTKNLGATGDAGCITTNDVNLDSRLRKLRTYGWGTKYQVELPGGRNSRLDAIQAAILRDLLTLLDAENDSRRAFAKTIHLRVSNPHITFVNKGDEGCNFHLLVARCPKREQLIAHLENSGIQTAIHYPIPDYLQPAWRIDSNHNLEVTNLLSAEILTLPCYPEVSESRLIRIINALNSFSPY